MDTLPTDDPARVRAVRASGLVDSPAEEAFDRYCRLARVLTGAPLSFVTLVLPDRQFFKSAFGFPEPIATTRSTPIELSLCRHVVDRNAPLSISNGPIDPEFAQHPAITELGLQAYLGIPIADADGLTLGSMCVADHAPREWTAAQQETLTVLAEAIHTEIKLQQAQRNLSLTQANARSEHALLLQIMQTSVAAVTVLDATGQIIFCNQNAERILGLKRSVIESLRFDAPDWQATALDGAPWTDDDQPFTRVLQSRKPVYDVQHAIVWPDGTRRYLSVNGAPIFAADGELERLVFLVNDITEQHHAKLSLRRAAEQFASVFRVSPHVAVLCQRTTGRIVEVSDGFTRSLKLARAACIDQVLTEIPVDFPPALAARLFTASSDSLPAEETDLTLRAQNGRLRLVKVRILDLEVGAERFVLLTGEDFTQQREQEQQRFALEAQLREAQKVEIVGRLAGGIAHDFNNILTAILGNAELIGFSLPADHELQDSVEIIQRAGQRAAEQIRQILTFSRRERAERAQVPLASAFTEIAGLLTTRLPAGVSLHFEPPEPTLGVNANSTQLHQILVNLLTNAIHAVSKSGHITLRAASMADHPDTVAIEVEDDGSGIDPIHLPHLFEPFFTTRQAGMGTGLGLALSRSIARSLDGDLNVLSRPGRTCFRLTLPKVVLQPNSADPFGAAAAVLDKRQTRSLRVLLVDDDPEVLLTGRLMLEQLNHQVETATSAVLALESLRRAPDRFDLLVTDNLMPEMRGIELLEHLRRENILVPTVIASGYGAAKEQPENLTRLNAHFVPKPFVLADLAKVIVAAVDG